MSPVRFEQPRDDALARGGSIFFAGALGRDLERAEMELLRQMLDDCFGARALLLGAGTDERLLDALHVQRRFVARIADVKVERRLPVSPTQATVVDPCNLPFENDAFDVVVLFHALDMAARPHQALREAARVLADGGRLIVTGFNPWSLWGLRRLFRRSKAPWNAHFLNPVRMTDWLSLLDFTVNRTEFARYRPPVRGGARFFDARALRIVKGLVRMPFGGVWLIKARHRAFAGLVEPVREERGASASLAAAARPTARGAARRRSDNVLPFEPRT